MVPSTTTDRRGIYRAAETATIAEFIDSRQNAACPHFLLSISDGGPVFQAFRSVDRRSVAVQTSIALAAQLSPGFVTGHGNADGQVQAPGVRGHWNAQALRGIRLDQRRRQALRFAAEDQCVAGRKGRVGIGRFGAFGEVPETRAGQSSEQGRPIIDDFPIEMLPVVEARPA